MSPASMNIATVLGRRVWDSRGRPTVEAEIRLVDGSTGRAIAPAGASKGMHEALELRDGGEHLGGYDVRRAVAGIRERIAPRLAGMNAGDQEALDRALIELDGTENRRSLGANATIAVSMAAARAAAASDGVPLWRRLAGDRAVDCVPLPEIQIFGGGAHAARRVDIQDFMVMCPGASSADEAFEWTAGIYRAAGLVMEERGRLQGVADEGGFWPAFDSNEEALEALMTAIERAGRRPGEEVVISLDVAASEFGRNGVYRLARDDSERDTDGMIELLSGWLARYPIASVEDPLAEDDPAGFAAFSREHGARVQIVGDDFLVTDAARVRAAAQAGTCNAVLVKPNQRGTLSETLAAWDAARAYGFGAIVSARSGETEDTTICDLAVGWGVPQIKVGSFARSERMAKWNEILRIEEALGDRARFAGREPLRNLPQRPAEPSLTA
ncbi:MAG: phosphopyruvate hydratase [Geminicoccaceae bacterium]|nr:phosphopyruvate hydratase [Geminicoccaceae bacterium]